MAREGETGTRHRWPDRAFHWLMAISVVALAATAFLPIVGLRFDWVPIHWISGLALTALLIFHLVRVTLVHGFREMTPGVDDLRELAAGVGGRATPVAPAKYDALQKCYHWTAATLVLIATLSGLLMLLKIDTPFWRRDPSILSDQAWGWVYVAHGLSALAILFVVIVHVYFSILPEHRALLRAMIAGRGPLAARGAPHGRS